MEMLNSKRKERHYLETLVKRLDIQVAEMRTISNVIPKLEGTREAALSLYKKPEKYNQQTSGNGPNNTPQNRSALDSKETLSSLGSLAVTIKNAYAQSAHNFRYASHEYLSFPFIQNVKANDTSNFDGSVFHLELLISCLLSVYLGILFVILTFAISFIVRPSSVTPSKGQHPKSYMEIMAMIQRGETPPGITEINDQPPPNPRVVPRIKNLGSALLLSGDKVVPWWHRKNVGVTEPTNGKRTNFYHAMTQELPVNTSWTPQPPSFAIAGEASAIRHS